MRRSFLALAAALLSLAPLHAAAPSLGGINPRGVQRGTDAVLLFNGARLSDAQEVLYYYPGVTTAKLEVVNDNQVKVTAKVAPDCRLGEHAVRLRTASGVTELRTFYVGALPAIDEKEPNSDFAAPQKIPLNVTVHGTVENEDVDYYAVELKKGQRLTAEIEGMRLGTTIFDPYLAILDAKRFELAAADDTPLTYQDAVVSIVAPADGTYTIMVREASYGGNGACVYRLHVGTFPRPLMAYPAGGKLGDAVDVQYLGDAAGPFTQKAQLPAQPDPRFGLYPQDAGGVAPSPVPFRLAEVGNVMEVEPNDTIQTATPATLPLALNGIISKPGDVDHFKFTAKKGQTFDVHCRARAVRSPLDPVMTLLNAQGGGLISNDDTGGPDSYFRYTFPADGEYVLQIRDHLNKGGPTYVYRVEFTEVKPALDVNIPKVALFSQERQTIVVPRGNRYATVVVANRRDVSGDLNVEAAGLPKGVALSADAMPANLNLVPVLFEAAADAPVAGTLADLGVRHADPKLNLRGGFLQTVELTTGGPGQSVYWKHDVTRAAVAVAQEVPFKISIVEPKVPLVQNGSLNLKVVAERQTGFKGPITLSMLFNPPGVGSASSVTIPEGQNEALYPLNANGGAQVRKWKVCILGQATVGNGPVFVSTQLCPLEIAPPYVAFNLQRSAVEQGKETEVFGKVTITKPFEGAAKVRLVGLPNAVTAPELEITKGATEIAFKVKTDKASPPGQHKNIFCQVVIPENGEQVVQSAGVTELRIDPPPPPKVAEAPKPMPTPMPVAQKPPEPAKPPEKRLSRLEKLRLEQQEKEKAEKP